MKKIYRGLVGILAIGVLAMLMPAVYLQMLLPDSYQVSGGKTLEINSPFQIDVGAVNDAVMASAGSQSYAVKLKMFRNIPIKEVQVQIVQRRMLVPAGTPFGITMFTKGVMVVGMSDIQISGENVNPSKEAGIKVGDILLSVEDKEVFRNDDIRHYVEQSGGNQIKMTIRRAGEIYDFYVQPVLTDYDSQYKAGIWVRDSSAGIGTLTYYDPITLAFAGLGHAICDVDTGKLMPLESGKIVDVNISGSVAGQSGKAGELRGTFVGDTVLGELYFNTEMGVLGVLNHSVLDSDPVPMAHRQEVKPGPAIILSTISGNKPQAFDVVIEKINYYDNSSTKNMVIKVVDSKLLTTTGGIVQGMSGSPIIQDGKLAGAVTHVFVNDPARGYAIFAENMDKQLNSLNNSRNHPENY